MQGEEQRHHGCRDQREREFGERGTTGSDLGIDITGTPRAAERFRQLIGTLATVVHPA